MLEVGVAAGIQGGVRDVNEAKESANVYLATIVFGNEQKQQQPIMYTSTLSVSFFLY